MLGNRHVEAGRQNTMQVATITDFGWNLADNVLTIDWENQAAVNERVLLLTKGCHCKQAAQLVDVVVERKDRIAQKAVPACTAPTCPTVKRNQSTRMMIDN